jgi:hypothetical protein
MRQAFPIFGAGLLCALLSLAVASTGRAKPPEPAPTCGQRGRVVFDKDSTLSDATGRKLARFSGGESAVTLLSPPGEGSDLVHIETGSGRGSFRIHGFIKAAELRIYTSVAVPVFSGHVWLSPGTRVVAAGSLDGQVRIEKRLSAPLDNRLVAMANCGALTFNQIAAPVPTMPANARVFLLKEPQLELFESVPPTGSPIFTLRRAASADNVRFFSGEQRGGFVHVQYQGEVTIDAWAKASDLTPLPRGETSDVPAGSYTLSSAPQLQLSQLPRVVKTTRELPLRLSAKEADAPIGVIEPDTEVFVMDTVASWAKVLPKSLHVLPVGDQSFWVKTAELGN